MEKGRKTTLEERIEIVSYCISWKDYALTIKRIPCFLLSDLWMAAEV